MGFFRLQSRLRGLVVCACLTAAPVMALLNAAPAQAAEPTPYHGRKISLDLQDANIHSVLRIISEVSGYNIVTSSDVHGEVTLRLVDVPWDQVLDIVLRTHGLYMVREGNVILIVPVSKVRQLYFN